jgi:plastocyanin
VCGDTASEFAGTCVECVGNAQCPGKVCDLASATCVAAPSCTDNQKNGFESDVDCGGTCAKCIDDKACLVGADCVSGLCSSGKCVTLTNGCSLGGASDMTAMSSAIITFANGNLTYAPKCLKVKAGTPVTFNGNFASHPLIGGTVVGNTATPATSGPFVPVTNTGTTKTFTMSAVGTFPYYCQPHGTLGMNGVVYVVP